MYVVYIYIHYINTIVDAIVYTIYVVHILYIYTMYIHYHYYSRSSIGSHLKKQKFHLKIRVAFSGGKPVFSGGHVCVLHVVFVRWLYRHTRL
jgi:hypothetical protein